MRRLAGFLLSFVMAWPVSSFGQAAVLGQTRTLHTADVTAPDSDAERELASRARVHRVVTPPDVVALYAILAAMASPEQKVALRTISPETKTLLWKHNLSEFARRHPDLTNVQREVIAEAIESIVALTFDRSCVDQCAEDRKVLRDGHRGWAEAVFPVEQLRSAFLRLGDESPRPQTRSHDFSLPLPDTLLGCDCASWYECWWHGECLQYPCVKQPDGCGFYFDDPCGKYCA
jgi:hypothetical protein